MAVIMNHGEKIGIARDIIKMVTATHSAIKAQKGLSMSIRYLIRHGQAPGIKYISVTYSRDAFTAAFHDSYSGRKMCWSLLEIWGMKDKFPTYWSRFGPAVLGKYMVSDGKQSRVAKEGEVESWQA